MMFDVTDQLRRDDKQTHANYYLEDPTKARYPMPTPRAVTTAIAKSLNNTPLTYG